MVVLNMLHNPVGEFFLRAELEGIVRVTRDHDLIVTFDEVVRRVFLSCSYCALCSFCPSKARLRLDLQRCQ